MKTRLITVSDVVLGYGSPQIADFSNSLCEILRSPGLICQPLVPNRRVIEGSDWNFLSFETIPTAAHPYNPIGCSEYVYKCLKIINRLKPDVLVISNYRLFDLLDGLDYRPSKVIHLALEDLEHVLEGRLGSCKLGAIRRQAELVNVWLFPEENRAKDDAKVLGIRWDSIVIFYNVRKTRHRAVNTLERSKRIVYAGNLDADRSVGRYIFDPEVARLPIDVYGDLQGSAASIAEMSRKIEGLKRHATYKWQLRWFGLVPGKKLNEVLPSYSFSLVFWLPIRGALLNAAPNKFFQAISAGVPVISAPHPQPKMLIERYGCGVVLDGWEKKHLLSGLQKAEKLMNSAEFDELLANCGRAVTSELSWQVQMDKFTKRFNVKDW